MAARRYEISLRVLKNISRVSAANTQIIKRRRNFVSPSGHVRFFYYINANEIPNHFALIAGVKGAIYHVAIATVIFSHVEISSFRAKARLVFHRCLYNKTAL